MINIFLGWMCYTSCVNAESLVFEFSEQKVVNFFLPWNPTFLWVEPDYLAMEKSPGSIGFWGHPIPVADPAPHTRLPLLLSLRWDMGEGYSNIEVSDTCKDGDKCWLVYRCHLEPFCFYCSRIGEGLDQALPCLTELILTNNSLVELVSWMDETVFKEKVGYFLLQNVIS